MNDILTKFSKLLDLTRLKECKWLSADKDLYLDSVNYFVNQILSE